jgi:hypothetical protein
MAIITISFEVCRFVLPTMACDDSEIHDGRISPKWGTLERRVGGEFRKRPEFLSFLSLIPSSASATFSLFFSMRSSSLSALVDLAGSVPWLPNPS